MDVCFPRWKMPIMKTILILPFCIGWSNWKLFVPAEVFNFDLKREWCTYDQHSCDMVNSFSTFCDILGLKRSSPFICCQTDEQSGVPMTYSRVLSDTGSTWPYLIIRTNTANYIVLISSILHWDTFVLMPSSVHNANVLEGPSAESNMKRLFQLYKIQSYLIDIYYSFQTWT